MLDLLVANAIEAMAGAERNRISLSTSLDARGWVMLEIRDSGRGMEPEVLEQAVEPFFSTKSGAPRRRPEHRQRDLEAAPGTLSLRSQPGRRHLALRLCVEPFPLRSFEPSWMNQDAPGLNLRFRPLTEPFAGQAV